MFRFFLAMCALGWAAAPFAQPRTYDADLVRAFLGLQGDEVLTPEAPDSLRALVPPDAVVIGTRTWTGRFPGVLVVARLEGPADAARAAYRDTPTPGWSPRPLPDPHLSPYSNGGFTTDFETDTTRIDLEADASDATANISFADLPSGGSYVRVRVTAQDLVQVMSARASPPPQRDPDLFDPHLPSMTAPRGGRQTSTSGSGGSDDYTARADLESDLAPDAVSAHYASQMVATGWTPAGESVSADVATSSWTRGTDDGPLAALLYIRRLEAGLYTLRAHVLTAR